MTPEQLKELQKMTKTEIAVKYLKDATFKKITEEEYKWLIQQGKEK